MIKGKLVINHLRRLASAGLVVAALGSCLAQAQTDGFMPPPVPSNLEVPSGNTLFMMGHAQGTQNYICLPSASGFSWTFFSPQATLFFSFRFFDTEVSRQIITHFLSPNPAENGASRVTWQSSLDSSKVWGKLALNGSSSDPQFVAAGAIPWLLLEKVGTQPGPNGGGILANTTFIQRLNTQGGIASADGCTGAGNIGATLLAPYSADYFFYKQAN